MKTVRTMLPLLVVLALASIPLMMEQKYTNADAPTINLSRREGVVASCNPDPKDSPCRMVIDGDARNYLSTVVATIDLGAPASVSAITVFRRWRDWMSIVFQGQSWDISQDCVTWISIYSTTHNGAYEEIWDGHSVSLSPPQIARCIRISSAGVLRDGVFSNENIVTEVQVWGYSTETSTPTPTPTPAPALTAIPIPTALSASGPADLTFSEFTAIRTDPTAVRVTFKINNSGPGPALSKFPVEIRENDGGVVATTTADELLAGQSKAYALTLNIPDSGAYYLRATLDPEQIVPPLAPGRNTSSRAEVSAWQASTATPTPAATITVISTPVPTPQPSPTVLETWARLGIQLFQWNNAGRVFLCERGGWGLVSGCRGILDPENLSSEYGISVASLQRLPETSDGLRRLGFDGNTSKANIVASQIKDLVVAYLNNQAAGIDPSQGAFSSPGLQAPQATPTPTATSTPVPAATPTPQFCGAQYTVKAGDTLSGIALKFYRDASKWPVIYDANKAVIGSNPDLIKPGQALCIPGPLAEVRKIIVIGGFLSSSDCARNRLSDKVKRLRDALETSTDTARFHFSDDDFFYFDYGGGYCKDDPNTPEDESKNPNYTAVYPCVNGVAWSSDYRLDSLIRDILQKYPTAKTYSNQELGNTLKEF